MGLDVHLEISRARPGRSLEEALRAAVVEGRLAPGTRLPATRALASDLGLSRTTVAAVFAQLTAEGWFTARVGAGTWVAERQAAARPGTVASVRRPGVRVDLRAGIPDTTGFPRREWLAAVRRAAGSPAADLGYPDPAGTPRLRAALAAYVARTRGVVVPPGGLVVDRDVTGRPAGAPKGNRTLDLLLTMETLCRLSYRGGADQRTGASRGRRNPGPHPGDWPRDDERGAPPGQERRPVDRGG